MKRKKLYSVLALGMAMSLMVSVPVSAAVSPDTGSADFPVVGDIVTDVKDNQEVQTGKDESGNVVLVVIPDTADSSDAIREAVNNAVKAENEADQAILNAALAGGATIDASAQETVKVPETVAEEEKAGLLQDSQNQFEAIKKEEIKADKPGLSITVTPVSAAAQSVAKAAAEVMANTLGLKTTATKLDGTETKAEIQLAASADISIPQEQLEAAGGSVKVTIPMTEMPDPSRFVYYVLHYDSEKGWETLPASVSEDGIVVATFSSFSPVFVVKAEKVEDEKAVSDDNNDNEDNDGDDNNGGSDDSSSSAGNTKVTTTPAAVPANPAATPANPAVSPKTGE